MKYSLPIYVSVFYAFLYLPLLVLGVFSFNSSRIAVWQSFTWDWYRSIFQNQSLLEGTANSIVIAVTATVISTLAGTLAAYALWKKQWPFLTSSLYLSLLTPEIVTGISLLAFFQWGFRFLHLQLGMHTVVLAHNVPSRFLMSSLWCSRASVRSTPDWKKRQPTSAQMDGMYSGM